MRLYFFRHGPAGSRSAWEGPDRDRPLTQEGATLVGCMSDLLLGIGVSVDAIITSPYIRSVQTAQIAANVLDLAEVLQADEALSPGFDIPLLTRVLAAHPDALSIMLVGHEPDFSFVISELTGGTRVVMKKGAVARVNLEERDLRSGRLSWLLPPSVAGCD